MGLFVACIIRVLPLAENATYCVLPEVTEKFCLSVASALHSEMEASLLFVIVTTIFVPLYEGVSRGTETEMPAVVSAITG